MIDLIALFVSCTALLTAVAALAIAKRIAEMPEEVKDLVANLRAIEKVEEFRDRHRSRGTPDTTVSPPETVQIPQFIPVVICGTAVFLGLWALSGLLFTVGTLLLSSSLVLAAWCQDDAE
jgi:hypothetical protein